MVRKRKLNDHIVTVHRKPKEGELEAGPGYKLAGLAPSDTFPPARFCLLKFSLLPTTGDQVFK